MIYLEAVKVNDLYSVIESVNDSIGGWEKESELINRKYIQGKNSIIFDIAVSALSNITIGYVIVRKDDKDQATAYLAFLAIHRVHQKQRIGSKILQDTIEKIRLISPSYKKLTLDCDQNNIEFYLKFSKKNNLICSFNLTKEDNGIKKYRIIYQIGKEDYKLKEKIELKEKQNNQ